MPISSSVPSPFGTFATCFLSNLKSSRLAADFTQHTYETLHFFPPNGASHPFHNMMLTTLALAVATMASALSTKPTSHAATGTAGVSTPLRSPISSWRLIFSRSTTALKPTGRACALTTSSLSIHASTSRTTSQFTTQPLPDSTPADTSAHSAENILSIGADKGGSCLLMQYVFTLQNPKAMSFSRLQADTSNIGTTAMQMRFVPSNGFFSQIGDVC